MKTRCTHGGAFQRKLRVDDVVVVTRDIDLPGWQDMCLPNFWYRHHSLPNLNILYEPLPPSMDLELNH